MGGGDLNMKKSWHPQRFDNVEKVWQREEAQKAERRRMEELRKEIQEERSMEEMRKRGEDMGVLKKQKDRLDWMYKGPGSNVNRDDYLLGKEVDKAVMDAPMESAEDASGSMPAPNVTVDIANKIREDPMFAIKKREISSRKELLNNPIRMKQLQHLLKKEVSKKDKKKRKKEKKEKKKLKKKKLKKSRHQSDSSSESSSDEDSSPEKIHRRSPPRSSRHDIPDHPDGERRAHKLSGYGLVGGSRNTLKHDRQHRRDRDSSEERQRTKSKGHGYHDTGNRQSGRDEQSFGKVKDRSRRQSSPDSRHRDRIIEKGRERVERHRSRSRSPQRRRSRSPVARKQRRSRSLSPIPRERSASPRHQRRRLSPKQQRRRSRSPSPRHWRRSRSLSPKQRRRKSRSPSPRHQKRRSRSPSPRYQRRRSRSVSPKHQRRRSSSSSPEYQRRSRSVSPYQERRQKAEPRRKMDGDEMARKRAEMMENAKWRDDQRKERVKQYEAEQSAEAEQEKKKSKNAKFLKTMKLPANSSVEDRIRSNIHNIQRTKAALDKNFARK